MRLPPGVVALPHDLKLLAENITAAHDKASSACAATTLRLAVRTESRLTLTRSWTNLLMRCRCGSHKKRS